MDGVFDLFHVGHLDAIKQCSTLGDVVIGIISDADAKSYKRNPIIPELQRVELIKSCKYVNEIIFPAPLIVDTQFIQKNNIQRVVHAFADENDFQIQKHFFENINLHRIEYSARINTSSIIQKIKEV